MTEHRTNDSGNWLSHGSLRIKHDPQGELCVEPVLFPRYLSALFAILFTGVIGVLFYDDGFGDSRESVLVLAFTILIFWAFYCVHAHHNETESKLGPYLRFAGQKISLRNGVEIQLDELSAMEIVSGFVPESDDFPHSKEYRASLILICASENADSETRIEAISSGSRQEIENIQACLSQMLINSGWEASRKHERQTENRTI